MDIILEISLERAKKEFMDEAKIHDNFFLKRAFKKTTRNTGKKYQQLQINDMTAIEKKEMIRLIKDELKKNYEGWAGWKFLKEREPLPLIIGTVIGTVIGGLLGAVLVAVLGPWLSNSPLRNANSTLLEKLPPPDGQIDTSDKDLDWQIPFSPGETEVSERTFQEAVIPTIREASEKNRNTNDTWRLIIVSSADSVGENNDNISCERACKLLKRIEDSSRKARKTWGLWWDNILPEALIVSFGEDLPRQPPQEGGEVLNRYCRFILTKNISAFKRNYERKHEINEAFWKDHELSRSGCSKCTY